MEVNGKAMTSPTSRNCEPLDKAEILKMADEITRVVDGGHHKAYGTDPHRTTMTAGNAWWRTVADAMRAFANSETRWIPVGERLPHPHSDNEFICATGTGYVTALMFDESGWRQDDSIDSKDGYWNQHVTHWMDMPEAPK
jgi:hypothetical protein